MLPESPHYRQFSANTIKKCIPGKILSARSGFISFRIATNAVDSYVSHYYMLMMPLHFPKTRTTHPETTSRPSANWLLAPTPSTPHPDPFSNSAEHVTCPNPGHLALLFPAAHSSSPLSHHTQTYPQSFSLPSTPARALVYVLDVVSVLAHLREAGTIFHFLKPVLKRC